MSQGWQYVINRSKKCFLQLTPFNPLYSQIFRENFAKNFPEPDCTEHTLDIVNLRNRGDPEHNWTFALFSVPLLVWRNRLAKDNPSVYLSWPKFLAPKEKNHSKCDFRFLFHPKKNYTTTVFFRNKYSTVVFMHHRQKIAHKTWKNPKFLPLSLSHPEAYKHHLKNYSQFCSGYLHLHKQTVIAELLLIDVLPRWSCKRHWHLVGEQLAKSIYLSRVGPPNNTRDDVLVHVMENSTCTLTREKRETRFVRSRGIFGSRRWALALNVIHQWKAFGVVKKLNSLKDSKGGGGVSMGTRGEVLNTWRLQHALCIFQKFSNLFGG